MIKKNHCYKHIFDENEPDIYLKKKWVQMSDETEII